MPTIIYCVPNRNGQEIEQYVNDNTNLPRLNFNEYDEEKPSVNEVDATTYLVINSNEENEEVKENTIQQAIEKSDEIIIPVKSISITEIQNLLSEDVNIHLPRVGVKFTRHSNVSDDMMDALTPYSDDEFIRQHAGGRAPLGTKIEDGFIVRGEDYQYIRETLQKHIKGDITKETAADRIGTTNRTVERAAQRDELYKLQ